MARTRSKAVFTCLLVCTCFVTLFASSCKRSSKESDLTNSAPANTSSPSVKTQSVTLLDKGKELYKNDHDSEAATVFEQALAFDPDFAEAHYRLGLCYESMNKADQAETEFKKAVESYKKQTSANSEDAEGHYQFGQVYAALHQFSDAVREYKQAIKSKDNDADIYYDLGSAQMKLAQYDEAVKAFSRSLEIDPENYRAEDALAEAKEGVERVKAGRKHQEDLLKKQKEDELKKSGEPSPGAAQATPGNYEVS